MHKSVTTAQRLCFVFFFLFVFPCNNNSDGLIINHVSVPTLPSELHNLFSSETGDTIHDRTTPHYAHNSIGTHHQWTGVLLLSLLQQEDDDVFGSTQLNKSKELLSTASLTSLTTANIDEKIKVRFNGKSFERDKVERILDANTIQLKNKGVVKLAGVRMPSVSSGGTNSNFQFPTCFTYSPSYKIRKLLPKNTIVQIETLGGVTTNNVPQVVLIRNDDSLVVNEELVKTGFAVVKNGFAKQQLSLSSSSLSTIDADALTTLQESARSKGLGIFSNCNAENDDIVAADSFVADFEPLERTMETVYLSDGGKQVLRDETTMTTFSKENPPKNPRDTKGCSDFETYEDALQWYEIYQPYFGDVAKLDRDRDGVPCPGLPHTSNQQRYRMKVPTASVGIK
jgi:endonuclease YncB( thermonuclease family)